MKEKKLEFNERLVSLNDCYKKYLMLYINNVSSSNGNSNELSKKWIILQKSLEKKIKKFDSDINTLNQREILTLEDLKDLNEKIKSQILRTRNLHMFFNHSTSNGNSTQSSPTKSTDQKSEINSIDLKHKSIDNFVNQCQSSDNSVVNINFQKPMLKSLRKMNKSSLKISDKIISSLHKKSNDVSRAAAKISWRIPIPSNLRLHNPANPHTYFNHTNLSSEKESSKNIDIKSYGNLSNDLKNKNNLRNNNLNGFESNPDLIDLSINDKNDELFNFSYNQNNSFDSKPASKLKLNESNLNFNNNSNPLDFSSYNDAFLGFGPSNNINLNGDNLLEFKNLNDSFEKSAQNLQNKTSLDYKSKTDDIFTSDTEKRNHHNFEIENKLNKLSSKKVVNPDRFDKMSQSNLVNRKKEFLNKNMNNQSCNLKPKEITKKNAVEKTFNKSNDKKKTFDHNSVINSLKNIDPVSAKQILNEIVIQGDDIHWDDIAGLDEAKIILKETVVYPFLRPDLFSGLREPTKGILLFGPPGTGKTMLARAVATESKSTFFSITSSSLTSKFLGESEKLIKSLFTIAKKLSPSIVFIDEIDSLLSMRSDGENESTRRIKNEFLVQWSGLSYNFLESNSNKSDKKKISDNRVLVLGATNLPWCIDDAARRRFVKRVYVPLPEGDMRKLQIVNLLHDQKNTLTEKDYQELISLTEGFSGSDITALTKDSAMGPLRSLGENLLHTKTEYIRPIDINDFKTSLKFIKSSISKENLEKHEKWAEIFGLFGT